MSLELDCVRAHNIIRDSRLTAWGDLEREIRPFLNMIEALDDEGVMGVMHQLLATYAKTAPTLHTELGMTALRAALAEITNTDQDLWKREVGKAMIAADIFGSQAGSGSDHLDTFLRDMAIESVVDQLIDDQSHRLIDCTLAIIGIGQMILPTLHTEAGMDLLIEVATSDSVPLKQPQP